MGVDESSGICTGPPKSSSRRAELRAFSKTSGAGRSPAFSRSDRTSSARRPMRRTLLNKTCASCQGFLWKRCPANRCAKLPEMAGLAADGRNLARELGDVRGDRVSGAHTVTDGVCTASRPGEHARTEFSAPTGCVRPCGVPKLCSPRGIIPICRWNRVLTPHTDDAEKPRG